MRKAFLLLTFCLLCGYFQPAFSSEIFEKEKGYTINFTNVNAAEYVRFVSKICDINFIFNEEDLQFTVTVISEEPIDKKNVLSTLTQTLRIHGLTLLEDDNNLLIHKNPDVKRIAPLVSEDDDSISSPVVTRVFRIQNATVTTIADIIRPMISTDALLETVFETRQIIVSDLTENIKKISELIATIDAPQNPLQIHSYETKINPPGYLIPLTEKIILPTANGNPFILVPQTRTGAIYIVSTPALVQRAVSVLENIDVAPKKDALRGGEENIFIYPLQFRTPEQLEKTLHHIAKNFEENGFKELDLIDLIHTMQWIKDTSSFLFTGSADAISKLQDILKAIDGEPSLEHGQFFLYRPQHVRLHHLSTALNDVVGNLHDADLTNPTFMHSIQSMQALPSIHSLLFTGDTHSLDRIQKLLQSIDIPEGIALQSSYFLYKLKYVPGDVIEEDLEELAKKFKSRDAADSELISVLENAKWIKETNSILLTGDAPSVEASKKLIAEFDVPRKEQNAAPHGNFFVYHPKHVPADFIEKSLKDTAENLKKADLSDPNFLNAIDSMRYIESTDSLAFTGNKESLEKIQKLIQEIDNPENLPLEAEGKATYLIYKIQKASVSHMTSSVHSIINDLKKSDSTDLSFIKALQSMRYEKETNSLVFTGTPPALDKVKSLLQKFDVATLTTSGLAPNSFYVYKPIYLSGPALEVILRDFADHLKLSGFQNQDLYNSILSMQWVEKTHSLMFTGDQESIDEIKNLLQTFDIPDKDSMTGPQDSIQPIDDTSFLVYKLQYHPGDEIKKALKQIAQDLIAVNAHIKENLLNAINTVQWIEMTNSLLCSGDRATVSKLKELIQSLDVPLKQVFIEILIVETTLTNLLNFGLDWGGKFNIKSQAVGRVSNVAPTSSGSTNDFATSLDKINAVYKPKTSDVKPFSSGFDLGVIGDIIMHKGKSFITLASLLNALQTDDETTIVMTPKMLAQDNKTTQIFIGRNLPYVGSKVRNESQTTFMTESLEYRDVGMKLAITPVLGNSDTITLTIDLESTQQLTNAEGETITSDTGLPGITTSKTSMNTTVHIPNKNFLVLSGMVNETKKRSKSGIPCLGGLPIIGAAFSEADKYAVRDNTVIFIRPHIVNSYKDMQTITENQEDFFRDNAGTPTLESDFEESVEMIKTYEDD